MLEDALISDPELWAAHNGFTLKGNRAIKGFDVLKNQVKQGILTPARGGLKFLPMLNEKEAQDLHEQYTSGDLSSLCSTSTEGSNPLHDFISHSFSIVDSNVRSAGHLTIQDLENAAKRAELNKSGIQTEYILRSNLRLPFAAKHYKISPNIEDYLLIPVPGIISDVPNTNGDSLSRSEMLKFFPQLGVQMYETFIGKPCFEEHDNKDITKAKGMIFDAYLTQVLGRQGNHLKISLLSGWDKTKDYDLCRRIESGEENAYSVGFFYNSYTCTFCNALTTKGNRPACNHTRIGMKPYIMEGTKTLVYRRCNDATGFEISSVGSPAFIVAISDKILGVM
jgi:hypothetical protein